MPEQRQIAEDDDGIRLDRWFKRHYPALTHGRLEKLLRKGEVRLDGKRAKAADRVAAGQTLRLPPQVIHDKAEATAKARSRRNDAQAWKTRSSTWTSIFLSSTSRRAWRPRAAPA